MQEARKLRKAVGPNLPLVMQAAELLSVPSTTTQIQAAMTKRIAREHVIRYCTQAVALRLMVLCDPTAPRTYVVKSNWREQLEHMTPVSKKRQKEFEINGPETTDGIVCAAIRHQPNSVFALGAMR